MTDKDQEKFVKQQKAIEDAKARRVLAQREKANKKSEDKK